MWDSSLSNVGEPNPVVCTNPCGEITLQEWEPCNLGHVNLAAFVNEYGKVDQLGLFKAHQLMTRFLIRATFSPVGDEKSREVLDRNRRIGVGHLGVASYLALTGRRYSKAPEDKRFVNLLKDLAEEVDVAADQFCHDLRIPVPVKKRTIAPTGTVAKLSGVSEGIHPIFSRYFIRRIRFNKLSDAETLQRMIDEGYDVEDDLFAPNTSVVSIPTKDTLVQAVVDRYGRDGEEIVEAANDLTLDQLVAFQALYQTYWADNAVSFTANVDPDAYTAEYVGEVLQ
jgi:adenosylcobalamin-dependent ribonucleoside-triphosphate reductase